MKTSYIFYCLLYAAGIEGAAINVEGFEGEEVSFQCSHKLAWKNNKYFCKDPCKDSEDVLVTVQAGGRVESGRIALVDSGDGVFTVTISQLQLSDLGRYWCAVDRPGFDTLTAVHLTVKEVVCAEASAVLEVSGHVGGEVSIHCSGSWTTNNSSEHYHMYFSKGVCSRETILIQTERKRLAGAWRGRYRMEVNRGDGAFNVTIKRLKRVDAGKYCCGVETTFNVLHQEVNLIVVDASTVPQQSPPSTTTLQTEAETLPRGSFASSSKPSPEASVLPATEAKTNQPAATHLREGQNKGESDYCDEHADVASTPAAVRLRSLEPGADPESSIQDASQFAAAYQALDPKSLD